MITAMGGGPKAALQVNGERSSVSDVGVDESFSAYLSPPDGISAPTFSSFQRTRGLEAVPRLHQTVDSPALMMLVHGKAHGAGAGPLP